MWQGGDGTACKQLGRGRALAIAGIPGDRCVYDLSIDGDTKMSMRDFDEEADTDGALKVV